MRGILHPLVVVLSFSFTMVVWSSHTLFRSDVRTHLSIMRACVDTLLASDALVLVCDIVAEADKHALEELSRTGFTYRNRRHCHESNYLYSILFYWLHTRAGDTFRGLANPLEAIVHIHPSLMPFTDGDYNEERCWAFHGVIIECLLAQCRDTGAAIPDDVMKDRQNCHDAIKRFADIWDDVMHCLNRCYVPCKYRPPTHNLADALEFASTIV